MLLFRKYLSFVFVDVIDMVVYVADIQGRDDFRMRPYRHVVVINKRYLFSCERKYRLKILSLVDANQFCNS
jgi:hypothetical protein